MCGEGASCTTPKRKEGLMKLPWSLSIIEQRSGAGPKELGVQVDSMIDMAEVEGADWPMVNGPGYREAFYVPRSNKKIIHISKIRKMFHAVEIYFYGVGILLYS
eukprot:15365185-Ditylum_brightwellii.AAC.2